MFLFFYIQGKDVSLRALGEAYKRLSLPYAGTVPEFQDLNMLTGVIEDFLDWVTTNTAIYILIHHHKSFHVIFKYVPEFCLG